MPKLGDILKAYLSKSEGGSPSPFVLTLEMNAENAGKVKAMMDEMGFQTEEEFFNFVLALANWAIKQVEGGNTIASIRAKNGGSSEETQQIEVSESVTIPLRQNLKRNRDLSGNRKSSLKERIKWDHIVDSAESDAL